MKINLETKPWWDYLEHDVQELLLESIVLIEKVHRWREKFHDYSFVVFPAAKAYEGFLKKLFLDMDFITPEDYYGKHFRIGKALNPSLEKYLREEMSVYDKIVTYCGGVDLADFLWDTWKTSRNILFHFFPDEKNVVDFDEAQKRFNQIISAFDTATKECKIKSNI